VLAAGEDPREDFPAPARLVTESRKRPTKEEPVDDERDNSLTGDEERDNSLTGDEEPDVEGHFFSTGEEERANQLTGDEERANQLTGDE
jgi:hypothetical protein